MFMFGCIVCMLSVLFVVCNVFMFSCVRIACALVFAGFDMCVVMVADAIVVVSVSVVLLLGCMCFMVLCVCVLWLCVLCYVVCVVYD